MNESTHSASLAEILARKGEAVAIPAGAGPLPAGLPQSDEARLDRSSGNGTRTVHDLVRLIARRPGSVHVPSTEASDEMRLTTPCTAKAAEARRPAPRRRQLTVRLDRADFVRLRDFIKATDATYQSVLSRAALDYIARAAR
jgi:hypothetical protein